MKHLWRGLQGGAYAAFLLFGAIAFAHAQGTIQQSGPATSGHLILFVQNGIATDGGPASGGGVGKGLSEILRAVRGNGLPPFADAGSGPLGTNDCNYDGPITSAAGYHWLCFSPNALGGGLIAYGAGGGAPALPLQFDVNGTIFSAFPPFRVISSGASDVATAADDTVDWKSAATSAKTETLYACTSGWKGKAISIVDDIGTAGTYPIAILPHAGDTILNTTGYVLNFDTQSVTFKCNGSGNWVAVP